jgi:hypothetical protein
MLSFFEMLGLLEAKKSTVGDTAVKPNATVEPAVEPKPQYSKENPHPEAGTIRSHNSGRVVNGKWVDYTPEELEQMKEPSKPSREVDPLVQSQVDQRSEKELAKQQEKKAAAIAELQRTENLKKYQQAWDRFTNAVLNARKKTKSVKKIAIILQAERILVDPNTGEETNDKEKGVETDLFSYLNDKARKTDPRSVYSSVEEAIKDALPAEGEEEQGSDSANPIELDKDAIAQNTPKGPDPNVAIAKSRSKPLSQSEFSRVAENLEFYNGALRGTAYSFYTRLAIEELDMPYVMPPVKTLYFVNNKEVDLQTYNSADGPKEAIKTGEFEVSLEGSRGEAAKERTSKVQELVMAAVDFQKVFRYVLSLLRISREGEEPEYNITYRQALAAPSESNPDMIPVIVRALKFEKQLERVQGFKGTIEALAEKLTSLVDGGLRGGLEEKLVDESDLAAVSYMIKVSRTRKKAEEQPMGARPRGQQPMRNPTRKRSSFELGDPNRSRSSGIGKEDGPEMVQAYQRPFNFFKVEKGADITDPKTRVYVKTKDELAEVDRSDDGTPTGSMYGSKLSTQMARLKAAQKRREEDRPLFGNPGDYPKESVDWEDVLGLLDYWNNK